MLLRIDESAGRLVELRLDDIAASARTLMAALDRSAAMTPEIDYSDLRAYAQAGIVGDIQTPRNWQIDPLSYQFREEILPHDIMEAYADFTFFTHGYLDGSERVISNVDGVFVDVPS